MASGDVASNIRQALGGGEDQGEAVQVDPIKPTLKAPGTKRLKLKYDKLLSSFAFKFNLRRSTKAGAVFGGLASAPLHSHSEFFGKER